MNERCCERALDSESLVVEGVEMVIDGCIGDTGEKEVGSNR